MNQRRQNVFESTCFHSDWLDMANDKVTVTFFSVNWMNWDGFDWNGFGSIWLNLAALKWMNETDWKGFHLSGLHLYTGSTDDSNCICFCLFVGHMLYTLKDSITCTQPLFSPQKTVSSSARRLKTKLSQKRRRACKVFCFRVFKCCQDVRQKDSLSLKAQNKTHRRDAVPAKLNWSKVENRRCQVWKAQMN